MSRRNRQFKMPNINLGDRDRRRDRRKIDQLRKQLAIARAKADAGRDMPAMPEQPIDYTNIPSDIAPRYSEPVSQSSGMGTVLKLLFLAAFATFIVLLYLWMRRNPRKCNKKECTRTISSNDNALRVVSAQLAAGAVDKDGKPTGKGCPPQKKSMAVQAALAATIKEVEY